VERGTAKRLGARWLLPLLGLLQLCATAGAQEVSEYQVKAAYVYNFAKFVDWPAQVFADAAAPFHMCVLNNRSFESTLQHMVLGKTIAGRSISVAGVQNGEQSRGCQILFIPSSQNKLGQRMVEDLQGQSVLTVGETKGFLEDGGIINFVWEDDRVQFQVNHRGASQAGLRVSSRLLSLARLVIE